MGRIEPRSAALVHPPPPWAAWTVTRAGSLERTPSLTTSWKTASPEAGAVNEGVAEAASESKTPGPDTWDHW